LYRFFIVDKQDPDTRLFSSAPFFVLSYATSQWAGSPFRPLVKISDLQIRAGSEPDSNTLPDLKLLKRLVLPWCRLPDSQERTSTELSLSSRIGCLFSGHQNWRPNASEKQRKFVKIDGFCSESATQPSLLRFNCELCGGRLPPALSSGVGPSERRPADVGAGNAHNGGSQMTPLRNRLGNLLKLRCLLSLQTHAVDAKFCIFNLATTSQAWTSPVRTRSPALDWPDLSVALTLR
jgi:hypothetical protein